MNQLFAAYARGKEAKELMVILGEAALSDIDLSSTPNLPTSLSRSMSPRAYDADRDIEETLDIGWKLLSHPAP